MTQGHYNAGAVKAFVLCAPALFLCCATAFAATYSNLAGSATGFQYRNEPRAYVVEQTHDFSKRSVTTGDIVRLIHVPPMARVLSVQASIVSASTVIAGDDQTLSVGDDADGTGWLAGVDPTGATSYESTPILSVQSNAPAAVVVQPAYALGKYYGNADTIDIRAEGRITNGQLRVRAAAIDLSR